MIHLAIFVDGIPRPQGSKNFYKGRPVEASKHLKPWRKKVALAARMTWQKPLLAGALRMDVTFWMPRPRSHYRTGKFSHLLKPGSPIWHACTPDRDKLLRAVGDALTGEFYQDDCQTCCGDVRKLYGERPGVEIVISDVDDPSDGIQSQFWRCQLAQAGISADL